MNHWRGALALCACLFNAGVLAADADAGEKAYKSRGCAGCHGPAGASKIEAFPVLKGRDAAYLRQQLQAFRSGARSGPTMNAMAQLVSDDDIANIAAYLGSR